MRDISIYDCVFIDAQFQGETDFGYIYIMLYLYINITIEKSVFQPTITKSAILIRPANTYSGAFIRIEKCSFISLNRGAVSISYSNQQSLNIKIINSMFRNISTTALTVIKRLPNANADQLSVLIENTTFIHNDYHSLYASQVNNITLTRNRFIENDYTPIMCRGSKIYFSGTTYMVGNKGYDGGALYLSAAILLHTVRSSNNLTWEESPPILYLHPGARLILKNNKASNKGGAIYVDTSSLYNNLNRYIIGQKVYHEPCFYQLVPPYGKLVIRHQKKLLSHMKWCQKSFSSTILLVLLGTPFLVVCIQTVISKHH
jgi:predicted outer membrane repeat protein